MYYVYILRCSDNTLYTGYTNDLENRINLHNKGVASKYTRSRRPVYLKYYEKHKTKNSALKRECEIKKLSRIEKIKLIVNSNT